MTVEGNMKGDTAKGKMGTTTSEGNMHEIENKQTQITFYSNKSFVQFDAMQKLHAIILAESFIQ